MVNASGASERGLDKIAIQTADFSVSDELAALHDEDARVGAQVSFVGFVREWNDGDRVLEMALEHYPGMTEKALAEIVAKARSRWDIYRSVVIHRVGALKPTDQIVLVAVTSAHRGEAFAACEYIIDFLKTQAPFWKREVTPEGARWVDARESDEGKAARWDESDCC